jgi:hypothetical protein
MSTPFRDLHDYATAIIHFLSTTDCPPSFAARGERLELLRDLADRCLAARVPDGFDFAEVERRVRAVPDEVLAVLLLPGLHHDLHGTLEDLKTLAVRAEAGAEVPKDTIDRDQVAALCKLRKASLKAYVRRPDDPLPDPDIPGGGGKRSFWQWSTIRPWIVRNFPSLPVPETCPSRR